jgi:hypothetical protein
MRPPQTLCTFKVEDAECSYRREDAECSYRREDAECSYRREDAECSYRREDAERSPALCSTVLRSINLHFFALFTSHLIPVHTITQSLISNIELSNTNCRSRSSKISL